MGEILPIIASSRIRGGIEQEGGCAWRSGSAAPATAVKALRPIRLVRLSIKIAGAGPRHFQGESCPIARPAGAPLHHQPIAALHGGAGLGAAHQPEMAAMQARQHIQDGAAFAMRAGGKHDGLRQTIPSLNLCPILAAFAHTLAISDPRYTGDVI